MGYPLDPDPTQMREMGEAALAYLIDFIGGLDDAPAENTEGAVELARQLRGVPSESGGPFADVFGEMREAVARTFEYAGPGYLAYIPGGGLFTAALGDFLALGVNRYVGLWQPSPAVVQIEENVTRWLCSLFGFPDETSQGILTTGGSMANFSAMVAARHAKLGEDFLDGTYYVTAQTHASVTKAAMIAGLPRRALRTVPTDDELRMDPDALRDLVRADRAAGRKPFLVAPAAGTTNTGAVDPLDAVADVATEEDLWMHVDAAYGGAGLCAPSVRHRFDGIEQADSLIVDPHKWLFAPYDCCALLYREPRAAAEAFTQEAEYLDDVWEWEQGEWTPAKYAYHLSRRVRGVPFWFSLATYGTDAYRDSVETVLELTRRVADEIRDRPDLELVLEPELSVVVFRRPGWSAEDYRAFCDDLLARQIAFVMPTSWEGEKALRLCFVNPRTTMDDVRRVLDAIE